MASSACQAGALLHGAAAAHRGTSHGRPSSGGRAAGGRGGGTGMNSAAWAAPHAPSGTSIDQAPGWGMCACAGDGVSWGGRAASAKVRTGAWQERCQVGQQAVVTGGRQDGEAADRLSWVLGERRAIGGASAPRQETLAVGHTRTGEQAAQTPLQKGPWPRGIPLRVGYAGGQHCAAPRGAGAAAAQCTLTSEARCSMPGPGTMRPPTPGMPPVW